MGPLLIQNASEYPDFRDHSAVRFGLNRYLGVPIHNPRGKPIGTLCFLDNCVDIPLGEEDIRFLSLLAMRVSAEVVRERMVQSLVEEHQAMAENLAELNARLEATAEAKRRFVATVLHDLRHPITAMRTLLFVLRDEQDPLERQTCIDLLENRLGVLAELLDALMQYNEIEAGHIRLNVEQVDSFRSSIVQRRHTRRGAVQGWGLLSSSSCVGRFKERWNSRACRTREPSSVLPFPAI